MDDIKKAVLQHLAEPSFLAKLKLLGWNDGEMIPLFTMDYGDRVGCEMYVTLLPGFDKFLMYWSNDEGGGGGWTEDEFKEDYQITSKQN